VGEWLEPPYSAGHWVSAQVETAGGREVFQRIGLPSTRVTPEEIVHARPEIIVLAPCGFHVDEVEREAMRGNLFAGWNDLPGGLGGGCFVLLQPTWPSSGRRGRAHGQYPPPRDLRSARP
jgi:iron complex transport system substrate-binding protein